MMRAPSCLLFFFFNDTATTEIYTLSLHDALPIYRLRGFAWLSLPDRHSTIEANPGWDVACEKQIGDRKSTRLNSSHSQISYAVFCLKKKKRRAGSRAAVRQHPAGT